MYSSLFAAKCFFHMYHLHLLIQTYKFKKKSETNSFLDANLRVMPI
jgi:hypothetical protein